MPEPTPADPIATLAQLLNHPARWRIFHALAAGEALPVKEVARRVGKPVTNVSKYLIDMRKAGYLEKAYGVTYRLAPAYLPAPGSGVIDLGPCLLKIPQSPAPPPAG
jgi:DNA-binding transcriptional ArsR family regulator